MFVLHKRDYKLEKLVIQDVVYNKTPARPSKSLLDTTKFIKFQKIDINNDLLYEFSSNYQYCIQHNKELVLKDILNKIKKYVDVSIFENDYNFEYNEFNIFETGNINILLEIYDYNIINDNLLNKLIKFTDNLQEKDILVFDYTDLFSYPNSEFIVILVNFFNKIKIYYSKFLMKNIIICISYTPNLIILNSIKEIKRNSENVYYKAFNIYLNNNIVSKIYRYNNLYLDYIINKNNILLKNFENLNNIIAEKQFIFNNFKDRIIGNSRFGNLRECNGNLRECNGNLRECNGNLKECSHDLLYSIFNDCYICKNCYNFFEIYL